MSERELKDWAKYHATLFGLNTEQDAEMLLAWVQVFHAAGIDPAELRAVSDWLAVHDAPRFRQDHLQAIQEHLRSLRSSSPPPDDSQGTCTLCDGTGRVIVPEPRALALGRWATRAVLCSCALGHWYETNQSRDRPRQQTLTDYASLYPDWRETMALHAQALRNPALEALFRARLSAATPALAPLGPLTHLVDKALGQIRRRHPQES